MNQTLLIIDAQQDLIEGSEEETSVFNSNQPLHGHDNVEHFSIVRQTDEDLFKPTHDSYR